MSVNSYRRALKQHDRLAAVEGTGQADEGSFDAHLLRLIETGRLDETLNYAGRAFRREIQRRLRHNRWGSPQQQGRA